MSAGIIKKVKRKNNANRKFKRVHRQTVYKIRRKKNSEKNCGTTIGNSYKKMG